MECRQLTGGLLLHCRDQEQQAEGPATQQDLTKLADDLVQKFEDQWRAAAENLEAASKAFDNLEGTACALLELPDTYIPFIAAASWLSLLCKDALSFFCMEIRVFDVSLGLSLEHMPPLHDQICSLSRLQMLFLI